MPPRLLRAACLFLALAACAGSAAPPETVPDRTAAPDPVTTTTAPPAITTAPTAAPDPVTTTAAPTVTATTAPTTIPAPTTTTTTTIPPADPEPATTTASTTTAGPATASTTTAGPATGTTAPATTAQPTTTTIPAPTTTTATTAPLADPEPATTPATTTTAPAAAQPTTTAGPSTGTTAPTTTAPTATTIPAVTTTSAALPPEPAAGPPPPATTIPAPPAAEPPPPATAAPPEPTVATIPAPPAAEPPPPATTTAPVTTTSTTITTTAAPANTGALRRYRPQAVEILPHDRRSFTQGLAWREGVFYESAGLYGRSSVRIVDPATGEVIKERALDDKYFGEGLEVVGERVVQLTWREETAFIWETETLAPLGTFSYRGEGWGLCAQADRFVMSDGSDVLTFRHLETFAPLGPVRVARNGEPVTRLNELECAGGLVYANIWLTDSIAVIDPAQGRVAALIDASGLAGLLDDREGIDVLNGIAYRPDRDRFYLTGKLWPNLFEVELVPDD